MGYHMANHAYLVVGETSSTAGTVGKGINYNPDTDVLAASSTIVPVLWLSLFDVRDLTHHETDGHRIATLVTSTASSAASGGD